MNAPDELARSAVERITDGMTVGLGTGRAATRAIRALGGRVLESGMSIACVSTSRASAELAATLGLRVVEMEEVARVDLLFDGADEVDENLRMLKGRGGAMTREKIVAHASSHRVYLAQESKLVGHIGERCELPVEVMRFALASAFAGLESIGLRARIRMSDEGSAYVTDNGNLVLDAPIPDGVPLEVLDGALNAMPGVVGHGLFLVEADAVFVESEDGSVRGLQRPT